MKPAPSDDDLDLMLGYPAETTTLRDLEVKLDRLERKIDVFKNELTAAGIGVIAVLLLHYFYK